MIHHNDIDNSLAIFRHAAAQLLTNEEDGNLDLWPLYKLKAGETSHLLSK